MKIQAPPYIGIPFAVHITDPEIPQLVAQCFIRHGFRYAARLSGCWQGLKTAADVETFIENMKALS